MLFPDMMNCMQTEDLELKKLVYLYCQNYAKTQPDLAIMAVNTFVKDSQDVNPLIRALAVRTMGCIRVDKITEYLCDPLQRCLKVWGLRLIARHWTPCLCGQGQHLHCMCIDRRPCHAPGRMVTSLL